MVTYTYDESGLRTRKYNGSEYTYYDRDASVNLVHETRNNGTNHLYYYYDANGSIGSISYNGVRYAFRKNLQGDVIAILDTSGNVVARYTYDAWGRILSITDGNGNANTSSTFIGNVNPIRYRGYYYDTETGWYYLNSRYYDPEVKRFINADGIIGANGIFTGYNMFAYCNNNPVIYSDPDGKFLFGAILLGALIGCALLLNGCAQPSEPPSNHNYLASQPDLDVKEAPASSYNCYGNALGKQVVANPTGYERGDSTQQTFEAVKKDIGSENVRQLDSIDSPISENEYKVAMKCGPVDYHFIRLDNDGWFNKSGTTAGAYIDQSIVEQDTWYPIVGINGDPLVIKGSTYYDDETIYFAVKVGWDE